MIIENAKLDYKNLDDTKLRCIQTLLSTVEGTQPLDRKFGINNEMLDYPMDVAKNLYVLEVTEKIEKYIPDINVSDITFELGMNGNMIPTIHIVPGEE